MVWAIPLGLLVLVLTLVPLQILDEQGLPRCRDLQKERDKLAAQNDKLRDEIRLLSDEVRALESDPRAIERIARQELGLVRPDDIVFQFTP